MILAFEIGCVCFNGQFSREALLLRLAPLFCVGRVLGGVSGMVTLCLWTWSLFFPRALLLCFGSCNSDARSQALFPLSGTDTPLRQTLQGCHVPGIKSKRQPRCPRPSMVGPCHLYDLTHEGAVSLGVPDACDSPDLKSCALFFTSKT